MKIHTEGNFNQMFKVMTKSFKIISISLIFLLMTPFFLPANWLNS